MARWLPGSARREWRAAKAWACSAAAPSSPDWPLPQAANAASARPRSALMRAAARPLPPRSPQPPQPPTVAAVSEPAMAATSDRQPGTLFAKPIESASLAHCSQLLTGWQCQACVCSMSGTSSTCLDCLNEYTDSKPRRQQCEERSARRLIKLAEAFGGAEIGRGPSILTD